MNGAVLRLGTWVPVIGFTGALAGLLVAPGLTSAGGETRTGLDLLRDAAGGTVPWNEARVVALVLACGAAVVGLLARRAPGLARFLALGGVFATAALSAPGAAGPAVGWYVAIGGFALAFLASRSPGCGPLG